MSSLRSSRSTATMRARVISTATGANSSSGPFERLARLGEQRLDIAHMQIGHRLLHGGEADVLVLVGGEDRLIDIERVVDLSGAREGFGDRPQRFDIGIGDEIAAVAREGGDVEPASLAPEERRSCCGCSLCLTFCIRSSEGRQPGMSLRRSAIDSRSSSSLSAANNSHSPRLVDIAAPRAIEIGRRLETGIEAAQPREFGAHARALIERGVIAQREIVGLVAIAARRRWRDEDVCGSALSARGAEGVAVRETTQAAARRALNWLRHDGYLICAASNASRCRVAG